MGVEVTGTRPRFFQSVAFIVANILAWPILIVIPMSFSASSSLSFPPKALSLKYYVEFFTSPDWNIPLFNSLLVAVLTVAFTLMLAMPAAFALARSQFAGKAWFRLLMIAPLLVPHIVLAFAYFIYFAYFGLIQSYTGVVIAHTCLNIPAAVLVLSAGIQSLDPNLERASLSLGAGRRATFWHVIVPALMPSIMVAGFYAFIHSFDEAVIAVFISGRDKATLPRQLFNSFMMDMDPVIAAASGALVFFLVAFVLVAFVIRLLWASSRTYSRKAGA